MSFGDAPHEFEPKIFQGREQLSCVVCGFMKDNFRHETKPQEVEDENLTS